MEYTKQYMAKNEISREEIDVWIKELQEHVEMERKKCKEVPMKEMVNVIVNNEYKASNTGNNKECKEYSVETEMKE